MIAILKSIIVVAIIAVMYTVYSTASSVPAVSDTGTLPPVTEIEITYDYNTPTKDDLVKKELMCLAKNIYFEAGTESTAGKIAVGVVTMNRVADKRWPNTVCGVVEQAEYSKWWWEAKGKKVPVRNRCQFSWYCDGKADNPYPGDIWSESVLIAEQIYFTNAYMGLLEGATHYHANYVNPRWSAHYKRVATIDNHIFYR